MVQLSKVLFTDQVFRTTFELKNTSVLRWFPGHMAKGVKQMQRKLKSVDCVIEVHDARIPFSGRNPKTFQTICGLRPHILVYNKKDLANPKFESEIISKQKECGLENVVFTNCKDQKCSGIKTLIPTVEKLIRSSCRHNRSENFSYCLMVVGIPNIGKSSIINALRQKYLMRASAADVGAKPGITRSVGEKIKISDDPLIYVLDTPGILTPSVPSVDIGMRLALCETIPDKEVGVELIADYLLFWLNKNKNFRYMDFFGVDNATDNIAELLTVHSIKKNLTVKILDMETNSYIIKPNFAMCAYSFVDAFRKGWFGKITLDNDISLIPERRSPYIVRKKKGYIHK